MTVDANAFERLIDHLRSFTPRSEITLTEVPAPKNLQPLPLPFQQMYLTVY
jgi:hypothetical protein